jgi:DnaA family protein
MAQQLTFELAPAPAPTLASFVAGRNAEVVDALARFARGELRETGLVLWGAGGAGKTHLLQAAVAVASDHRRPARFLYDPEQAVEAVLPPGALVAVDRIDAASDAAQARLFTLYNALAATGGQLVAAAGTPPARMRLRDDLRTRLGWGLVLEVVPLADADKPQALAAFAAARGFALGTDVIAYLLAHGRRDMATLVRTLIALDRHSLALRRPVTVPLIREWLQRPLGEQEPPAGPHG